MISCAVHLAVHLCMQSAYHSHIVLRGLHTAYPDICCQCPLHKMICNKVICHYRRYFACVCLLCRVPLIRCAGNQCLPK